MLKRYKTAATAPCPRCGCVADRIPRRPLDHLLSVFASVCRYRCRNFECRWEGNRRKRKGESPRLHAEPDEN